MDSTTNKPQYTSKLLTRIKEFNSALKLGIDLGTKTGGIALVKDNKILAAKTFLDYHNETLKDRRAHRRNRRSRLAKRKRVARLRSWVLRHSINGKQLPDPYKIKNLEFFNHARTTKNWSEAVIKGQDTSPEAFVRALTLVFRKRGQSYEEVAREIADMTSKKLGSYINSMTSATEEELNALQEEIEVRQASSESSKEMKQYDAMLNKLADMAKNKKDIKDRKQRKEEISSLVEAFCKANGVKESDKWSSELEKLLDKPVRRARFMNRVLITCNICDKPTPKKSKSEIRKLLYIDAVRNFLKAGRTEPTAEVLDYYNNIYEEAGNIRAKILRSEALTKDEKKRMISLSKKLNAYKNKEYGQDAQKYMLEQIKTILYKKLSGRARYCSNHLRDRSSGIDVEKGYHGKIQKRHDRNIAQQNHDKRIVNLIERLLFDTDKSISEVVKNDGIRYITIEAPESNTKRARKHEITKADTRTLKEKLFSDQGGFCIYTGQKLSKDRIDEYEKDHIFPYSRDGPSIRDNLVLTSKETNLDKGDRTPWEWLGRDDHRWKEFVDRVKQFYKEGRITARKMELLLNNGDEFPGDNPTELARSGARVNNFIAELNACLKRHGIQEAQTLFENGKPVVQVVRGNETQRLRRQWNAIDPKLIPLKDRAVSFNHAEDAAIAASMPPSFWREQIYRYTWHFNTSSKERPDFAISDIAPLWEEFVVSRKRPIITVLGKTKYSWKKNIIDDTFYKKYNENSRFNELYKQPTNKINVTEAEKIVRLEEHKMNPKSKYYHKKVGNSRFLIKSTKGGSLITIKPHDGPERQIQINPTYRCAVLTKNSDGKIMLRYKPISPILMMSKRGLITDMDKELRDNLNNEEQSEGGKELKTHDIIWLPATKRHSEGYFLISKLNRKGIQVIREDSVKVYYAEGDSEKVDEPLDTVDKKAKGGIALNKEDLLFLYNNPEAISIK